jgi:hypothetical protein
MGPRAEELELRTKTPMDRTNMDSDRTNRTKTPMIGEDE